MIFMKQLLCVGIVLTGLIAWSQDMPAEPKNRLKATGTMSINSNGIVSIPAFALGDPAVISTVSLIKGRFSYTPVLAYGFDLKPWYIDNWLHYKFITRPVFELKAGFNYSTFFSDYKLPNETILQGERYFAYAVEALYTFRPKSTLLFAYWNDRGQEPSSLIGHYGSITAERTEIGIGKSVMASAAVQLFYINYTGNNDGLFVAPKITSSVKKIPLILYFQCIQPIKTNIEPKPVFTWNIGLAYIF